MVPPADESTTPAAGDTQPVTYVVQRWNTPTPDAEAAVKELRDATIQWV